MKLLVVDVEHRVPDVPPASVGEQWVLVRLHGEPLGMLELKGGCRAADLSQRITREFAPRILRHLAGDAIGTHPVDIPRTLPVECPRFAGLDLPFITVAVCTRNGAERLPSCLRALGALRYPASRIERLVIDNAPTDRRVRDLVEEQFPAFRYLAEPRPGLDWARNRAIIEARGEVIAFTDDDVSVDADWALALGRSFASDPQIDVITGLVVPDEIDYTAQRLFEDYGGFGRGYDRQYFKGDAGRPMGRHFGGSGRFGTGANMAFRRSLFDRIGGFDPALDVGTPANGGGDLDIFFRALKAGGVLLYEPSAIVRHRHRASYEQLKVQLTNNGVGFYAYLVRTAAEYPDERMPLLRLGVWWLWWWNVRRLLRSLVRPRAFPRDLVIAELRGVFTGLVRYPGSKRRARAVEREFGPQLPAGDHGVAS